MCMNLFDVPKKACPNLFDVHALISTLEYIYGSISLLASFGGWKCLETKTFRTVFVSRWFRINTKFKSSSFIRIKSTDISNIKCNTILDCSECQLQDSFQMNCFRISSAAIKVGLVYRNNHAGACIYIFHTDEWEASFAAVSCL